MSEHYFSADPASTPIQRNFEFDFLGEAISVRVDSGIFSATRIDPGTKVLLGELEKHVAIHQSSPRSRALDIGCGWGAISLALAKSSAELEVIAIDVNQRALDNTKRNAKLQGLSNVQALHPTDVPPDLEFDEIWSNPPIRIGKEALHELLQSWLARLSNAGIATFVVAKQLGAPSLQRWLNGLPGLSCSKLSQDKGFWVLRVKREA